MSPSRSHHFWKTRVFAALSGLTLVVVAQGAVADALAVPPTSAPAVAPPSPIAVAPAPLAEEARKFLQVDLAHDVCKQPLTLAVENATLDDIALRVQKAIKAANPTSRLRVEVRHVLPVRLSFAAKGSTVGEVLSSSATLAGAQLWIFSDHLLLAPQEALSPDELNRVKSGFAIESQGRFDPNQFCMGAPWDQPRAFTAFIADEIKGLQNGFPASSAKADTPFTPLSEGKTVALVNFGQLSPDAQGMLQQLVALQKQDFYRSFPNMREIISQAVFSAGTPVEIVSRQSEGIEVAFPTQGELGWQVFWSLDGGSESRAGGVDATHPKTSSSTAPSPIAPFDPSAGKS